jgi:hypothetical protein
MFEAIWFADKFVKTAELWLRVFHFPASAEMDFMRITLYL